MGKEYEKKENRKKNLKRIKDFENKPLPDHTKLDYYECLAKIVLEDMFPEEFGELKVNDRPDLQNEKLDIGVEVTLAINKKQLRNEKLYTKIRFGTVRNKEKSIKEINSSYKSKTIVINGKEIREPERYNDALLYGIPDANNFKRIQRSFRDKTEKLNTNIYKKFNRNYLFVHSTILSNEKMLKDAALEMIEYQDNYKIKFLKVIIFVPEYLYVCDLQDGNCFILSVKNEQYKWACRARNMVIQAE